MAYEKFIQELPVAQANTEHTIAQNAAARSVLAAISARFPSLQRLLQLRMANTPQNDARINEAVRLLSTNSPTALQQAIAVMSGLPTGAEQVNS